MNESYRKIILFSVHFFFLLSQSSCLVDLALYDLYLSLKIKYIFNHGSFTPWGNWQMSLCRFMDHADCWDGQKALSRPFLHPFYLKTGLLESLSGDPSFCQKKKRCFLPYSKTNDHIKHSVENPDETVLHPVGKECN